jgi:hypothetical protein
MAEFVTIRDPRSLEEKRVSAPTASRFFPGWELVVDDQPPAKNAKTAEWAAYAVKQGLVTEEAAADMGRDELIALVPATTTEEN